jgi:cellobiose transport system permease protein
MAVAVATRPQSSVAKRRVPRRLRRARPLTYLVLIVVALVSVFPLYWSLVVASHDNSAVGAWPPVLVPGPQLWHNLTRLFTSDEVNVNFWLALLNSFIVASCVTVAVVFFSALAGFAFAKLRFHGQRWLLLAIVVTLMVPTQLGIIPLYIEVSKFGWANHLQALIVPALVSAFGVFFMRQYLLYAVPNELVDAARADGCHTLRVFWHVILPATRPAAAVLGFLTFTMAWNDFFWPLIVLSPSNPTVQVAVSTLASGYVEDYALVLAGTFVSIIPLLVLFLFLGRQVIGGIMEGAVKG